MARSFTIERRLLVWLFGFVMSAFLAFSLSACNTMEGMGEDVEAAGGAMSDTAEDVEDEIDEETE